MTLLNTNISGMINSFDQIIDTQRDINDHCHFAVVVGHGEFRFKQVKKLENPEEK